MNNSFTNSYYQPAKWKFTSAKTSMGHKLLCCVFTTKKYTSSFLELWMQSGYRATCLQQIPTFTWLKEHKPHHPEALSNRRHYSFPQWVLVSLREQLQSTEELPKYTLVLGTTRRTKTKKNRASSHCNSLEWVPKIHIPHLVFSKPSHLNFNETVKNRNQVDI